MAKILVTGATGAYGKEVIEIMLRKTESIQVAALARDTEKAKDLIEKGVDVREGNYEDYNSLVEAFQGIDKLMFVSGSEIPTRVQQHTNVVKAAVESGVKHVVYTSFMRKNETDSSPIYAVAESHLKTEALLKESGLKYTILQHNLYLDLLPLFFGPQVVESGMIYLCAGEGKTAFALRSDMAKAGAAVLLTSGHENKIYKIAAQKAYSFDEIAGILSDVSGKEIKYISPSQEEFTQTLTEAGVPAEIINMNIGFLEGIKQTEFDEPSESIEKLTGESEISVKDYLKSIYKS